MTRQARTFSTVEVEASEWLIAMSDRTVSLDQRARFEAWLNADPEHGRIYQAQKTAWSAVAHMPQLMDEPAQTEVRRVAAGQRLKVFALAAAAVLVVLAVFFRDQIPLLPHGDAYETATAQVKDVMLSDGTLVTLGASSHIDVDFSKNERHIALTRGEAYFEVAHDTARPLSVTAGTMLVRVIGTKFDVHYGSQAVRVAVAEGRVEIMKATDSAPLESPKHLGSQVLTAGEAAVAESTGRIATTDSVNKEDFGAWRSGRLVYVDTRLRDVIADINRYYNGKIELAAESTGDLQLTIAFRADQIDRMLEVLQDALPVQATHTPDGRIVISEKPSGL
jgi:transmembrane sensor